MVSLPWAIFFQHRGSVVDLPIDAMAVEYLLFLLITESWRSEFPPADGVMLVYALPGIVIIPLNLVSSPGQWLMDGQRAACSSQG